MNILFIAKHSSGGNDDEDAVTWALEQLGHNVIRLREDQGHKAHLLEDQCDFVLFFKWSDYGSMSVLKKPLVCWYFDLVEYPDPMVAHRNMTRVSWMSNVIPLVKVMFCTDGDWVNKDQTGKLVRLCQGADRRVMGAGAYAPRDNDILFTGIRKGGGAGRISFVDEMAARYGQRFLHVQNVHGRALADLIARSKIVVAPDHPITDNYWSNRVYNTLGFGGFLLHPYAETLSEQYDICWPRPELVMYRSRSNLHDLINGLIDDDKQREGIARSGFEKTLLAHTYTHRCEELVRIVKERVF